MEEKKKIYDVILAIWRLWQANGFKQELTDDEWDCFVEEGKRLEKQFPLQPYNLIFRDMYLILTKYYEGKYGGGK